MKTKYLLPFLLLLFTLTVSAQDKKHDQIKALKVSFFTTELKLSSEEAAKFWPIYNQYDDKQFAIRHDRMKALIKKMDDTGLDKLTEKDAAAYLEKMEAADKELFDMRQKLVRDLKPAIGSAKILMLKKAEEDFKRKLIEQFKDKKHD